MCVHRFIMLLQGKEFPCKYKLPSSARTDGDSHFFQRGAVLPFWFCPLFCALLAKDL